MNSAVRSSILLAVICVNSSEIFPICHDEFQILHAHFVVCKVFLVFCFEMLVLYHLLLQYIYIANQSPLNFEAILISLFNI